MNDREERSAREIDERVDGMRSIIKNTKNDALYFRALRELEENLYPVLYKNYSTFIDEFHNFDKKNYCNVPADDVHSKNLWQFYPIKLGSNYPYVISNGVKKYNYELFANTTRIIESSAGCRLAMIGLSKMMPGCVLKPHTGYNNDMPHNVVLRTHVPLISPSTNFNDLGLAIYGNDSNRSRVPSTQPTVRHTWSLGKIFTFDDTLLHEAWNKTNESRVVLMIDTFVENRINEKIYLYSPLTNKPVPARQYVEDFQVEVFESWVSFKS